MLTVQDQIFDHIRSTGRGKVFISKDFLNLGSRDAIDQALSRLTKTGEIQRLGRGLYHFPQRNERLGISLSPDADEIADALARQTGSRIAPSGAVAANRLGLSTQVPAKPVYLTDGRTRQVRVGNFVFVIKHVPPKELPLGSRISTMVFQALRHLGRSAVDSEAIARLRHSISPQQKQELLRDARYTTDWIAEVVRLIAAEKPETVTHG
jgi:Family of unknown function (DUF6088)